MHFSSDDTTVKDSGSHANNVIVRVEKVLARADTGIIMLTAENLGIQVFFSKRRLPVSVMVFNLIFGVFDSSLLLL